MNAQANILSLSMTVSKKEGNKHVEVGKVEYFVPTLAAFGLASEQAVTEAGQPMVDEGLPVYKAEADNWLMSAIHASVKAMVRNRLISGTADLKPGQTIPQTLAEITAETERSGNGAYLKVVADLKKLFAAWVAGLGKSAGTQVLLNNLFGSKTALSLQSTDVKQKIAGYIADFAETLDPAQLEAGQRYLQSLLDVCSAEVSADDF